MANSISHAALPYPIRKARFSLLVPYLDSTGTPTDPTTPDTELSLDGGSFADAVEEVSTITGSNGMGYITLTGAEMDNSAVGVAFKVASGPKNTLGTLYPKNLAIVGSGTLSAGSSGGGTLGTLLAYDVTGCFIRTTGGTGGGGTGGASNQARRIITYNTGTGAFTVSPNWETTPSTDTTYDVLLPEGVTLGMLKALNPATAGRTLVVDAAGLADANAVKLGPSGSGTAQTARDIGASVLLSAGTGTGQISLVSGAVLLQATQTGVTIPTVTTLTNLPAITAGWLTATGIASAAITAAKFGTDAIDSNALATSAAQEIRNAITGGGYALNTDASGNVKISSGTGANQLNLSSGVADANLAQILGSALSETSAGYLAAAFKKLFDVATPVFTAASVNQTGDSYARIGSTGSGLTSLAPASTALSTAQWTNGRAANLDNISSAPPSSATIAAAVWDLAISGHTTSGTFGAAMNAAGSAGDPWATALPGSYTAGQAGYIIGNRIDAAISSRSTYAGGDTSGTTTLLSRLSSTRAGYLDNLPGVPPTITGTVLALPAPTSSQFTTDRSEASGVLNDRLMIFTSGVLLNESKAIWNYAGSGLFQWDESWSQSPSAGDTFKIVSYHTHSKMQIASTVWSNSGRTLTALGFALAASDLGSGLITSAKFATDAIDSNALAASAAQEIRNALTGGAYPLNTDSGGNVKISSGTGANQLNLSSGNVTVGTNNDKTGYTLTQTFPSNFSALAITVAGGVTADSLATQAKADVKTQIVAAINSDTYNLPTQSSPTNTQTIVSALMQMTKQAISKHDESSTLQQIYNSDNTTVDQKRTVSQSGGVTTLGRVVAGP